MLFGFFNMEAESRILQQERSTRLEKGPKLLIEEQKAEKVETFENVLSGRACKESNSRLLS